MRIERGVSQKAIGQGLQAKLPRNLALGAALLLEGLVNVFQFLLRRRVGNGQTQRVGQLALLVNGLEHHHAALSQFAQVRQACFQLAQLHIVQTARGLFAVARNKGHGGPAVEQLHGSSHLLLRDTNFCGNLPNDFVHAHPGPAGACNRKRASVPQPHPGDRHEKAPPQGRSGQRAQPWLAVGVWTLR